jgi:hypothetical protein
MVKAVSSLVYGSLAYFYRARFRAPAVADPWDGEYQNRKPQKSFFLVAPVEIANL